MSSNVVYATFKEGVHTVYTKRRSQYDKGVTLRISGIALPEMYKAQFSNDKESGISGSKTVSGSDVRIPDVYFRSGKYIYVWLYMPDNEMRESGSSEYMIVIPVDPRPDILDISGNGGEIVATLDEEDHALVFEYR